MKRASELLTEVARQGEESGFGVPSLLIAAKNDLNPYPMAVKDSAKVFIYPISFINLFQKKTITDVFLVV